VLSAAFKDINAGDKILKEVVGHDVESDFLVPNAEARREKLREAEFKLILSSNYKGWNFTENTIAEKNLTNSPWEFGYALGASRPLTLKGAAQKCNFCFQHFIGTTLDCMRLRITWLRDWCGTCLPGGRSKSSRRLA
jgi:hypothetical protein